MSALTLAETNKSMLLAVRNCGHWPTSAELSEYLASVDRAAAEVDRAVTTWQRWTRRFSPDPNVLELGSGRIDVRREVAKALFEGRSEAIRLLLGPAAGSA